MAHCPDTLKVLSNLDFVCIYVFHIDLSNIVNNVATCNISYTFDLNHETHSIFKTT